MDVIVEDDYIKQMGVYLKSEGENIEALIRAYVNILRDVCENGIITGQTAEALKEFTNQARELLGTAQLGSSAAACCENYITRVDKADKDLY